MSIVLDLILLLIVVITILGSLKKGLVKTVIDSLSLILSSILAIIIAPAFKETFGFVGEYSKSATYIIIFLVSWVAVKIASILLDKIISSIPLIKTVNKLGGLILGILLGIFRVSVYCMIVGGVLAIGYKLNVQFIQGISIDDTFLLKYIYEFNPINILVNLFLK